jgi:hypothetical protein
VYSYGAKGVRLWGVKVYGYGVKGVRLWGKVYGVGCDQALW